MAYDAHHSIRAAQALLEAGQVAETVYTDAGADAAGADPTLWVCAEACDLGHARGWEHANYAHAYEQATRETPAPCEVPSRFAGQDAQDYRDAFAAGVSDFWDYLGVEA